MKKLLLAILGTLLITSFSVGPTCAAINFTSRESLLDFFDKNGIYYYDPTGFSDNCYAGVGSYDGAATAGLSDLQSAFVDQYHDIAAQLSSENNIPWEAVVAQGILESASGTSPFARERYNFFGLGAVDNNPSLAYTYSSVAEGWQGYFNFIKDNPRYRTSGAFNHPNDPYAYIQALKRAGYATDERYVEKTTKIIQAIQNRAQKKGWETSKDLANSSIDTLASYLCADSVAGNGNVNATALALSWPDRSHELDDPRPLYRRALELIGLTSYAADSFVRIGASCDAFVATVLRYSGADPNVPCCGTGMMLNYFASHPEKYQEIPNIGNSSNLQGGDIRIKSGHTEIYVTDESGSGRIASASHGERTADHGIGYYTDSGYRIFRVR